MLPPQPRRTLWLRMAEIYGHRWTSAYGEDPDTGAGETWAKGLAGVSTPQLAAGLGACIASADPWPPTLPEFRARCLGIPTLAQVKLALRDESAAKPPFIVLIFQTLDYYNWRHGVDVVRAERMLRDAYDIARDHVMFGGELPTPAAAELESPQPESPQPGPVQVAPPERAERARREIFGKDAAAGHDA